MRKTTKIFLTLVAGTGFAMGIAVPAIAHSSASPAATMTVADDPNTGTGPGPDTPWGNPPALTTDDTPWG